MGAELKLASLLLQYPSEELRAAAPDLREAALELDGSRRREPLVRLLDWLLEAPLGTAQRAYVDTFDFSRRASLHLTYHRFGDLRQRGLALLRIKQRYAAAGLELDTDELPDFLPLMLEFAALEPRPGAELLNEHREALELLRAGLHEAGSPFALALDAVVASLPRLTRLQAARAARMAADGPPSEEVGLEPFAPPEVMPSAEPGR